MKLILTRHAKSSWDDPRLDDFERPLNKRGRHACETIGRWLAQGGHVPDQVLHSSAVRTTETWARIAPHLNATPDTRSLDGLYHAGPERMLATLAGAVGETVMLIAHNPGIAGFAHWLAATPPTHPRFGAYPTAATLILGFDGAAWSDVAPGGGRVIDFVVPRDLA